MRFNLQTLTLVIKRALWGYAGLYLLWVLSPATLALTPEKTTQPKIQKSGPNEITAQREDLPNQNANKSAPSDKPVVFELNVKPNKCIALHKGQDCYQTLNLYWRTPAEGEFCLMTEGQSAPVHCWQGAGVPPLRYEFVGQATRQFYLRAQNGEIVQTTAVVVAWVYTSGKRDTGGWRLF